MLSDNPWQLAEFVFGLPTDAKHSLGYGRAAPPRHSELFGGGQIVAIGAQHAAARS